jgi:lipopolysaccharide/colanic/teichoic acid biosynthesis glycosyltransferase
MSNMLKRRFDIKRLLDVVLAFAGLALLSPVMLVVAALIRLDSPGPVLFRQRRVGRRLRCFTLLKFRTMIPAREGREITFDGDCRITRLGRLLRQAKIDELPQLWNILSGDMSFVGPRPLVESTVNRFREEYRLILFHARPGVTDPASIKYRHESAILASCADPVEYYFSVIMPDKIRLQKRYLRERTVLRDIGIMAKTLTACCNLENSSRENSIGASCHVESAMPVSNPFPAASTERSFRPATVLSCRAVAPFLDQSPSPDFPMYMQAQHEGSFDARAWEMDAR